MDFQALNGKEISHAESDALFNCAECIAEMFQSLVAQKTLIELVRVEDGDKTAFHVSVIETLECHPSYEEAHDSVASGTKSERFFVYDDSREAKLALCAFIAASNFE